MDYYRSVVGAAILGWIWPPGNLSLLSLFAFLLVLLGTIVSPREMFYNTEVPLFTVCLAGDHLQQDGDYEGAPLPLFEDNDLGTLPDSVSAYPALSGVADAKLIKNL